MFSGQLNGAVVVTVLAVRVMQVSVHQVIDVITVRYRRMPTVRAVDVICVVALAVVSHAAVGVGARDLDGVFVVVVFMGAVKVPVVQVPHMVSVLDGNVATVRAVLVRVVLVDIVCHVSDLPVSRIDGYRRIRVVEDVSDECLHVCVRQAVEHVSTIAPALQEILLQEDP